MSETIRPTVRKIISAVSEEFGVDVTTILSFEKSKPAWRARAAVALVANEIGYGPVWIARAMQRDQSTIASNILSARVTLRHSKDFEDKVSAVRAALSGEQKRKPQVTDDDHLRKLAACRAEILRLRHLYGHDRGWSADGLSRHFGIPKHVIAPVIGVNMVER